MADLVDVQELRTIFSANTKQLESALIRHGNRVEAAGLRQEKAFRESNAKIARSTQRMANDVRTALAGIGVGLAIRETVQLADAWTLARNKIAAATEISGLQARSLNEIAAGAIEARAEFEPYVDLYARILRASKGVAESEAQVAQATNTVAKAFKAGGAAASEQAAGITQLGQALGSGFLQGDELRSLRENAPVVLQALADEFDTTLGGLKELGAQGELTSERFFKALLKAEEGVNRAFAQTIPTISDSFAILNTRIGEFINAENQATGATASLSQVILFVADNVETLAAAITVAGAALAGYFGATAAASVIKGLSGVTKGAQGATAALAILNGVIKGFGGPLVLGVTALATAVALLAVNAKQAEKPSERLRKKLDDVDGELRRIAESAGIAFDEIRDDAASAAGPVSELEVQLRKLRREAERSGAAAQAAALDASAAQVIDLVQKIADAESEIEKIENKRENRRAGNRAAALEEIAALEAQIARAEGRLAEARALQSRLLRTSPDEFRPPAEDAPVAKGEDTALKAAQTAVDQLRASFAELGQTAEDAIELAYAKQLEAIGKIAASESERAALTAEADGVRQAALTELAGQEDEAARKRRETAEEELSDQRRLVNEVLSSRDQMYGRISSLAEADYRRRRALIEAEIDDAAMRGSALAALDAEQAEIRRDLEDRALGRGEGDTLQAEIERIEQREQEKTRLLEDWAATQLDLAEGNIARQLEVEEAYQARRKQLETEANEEIAAARYEQAQRIVGAYEGAAGGVAEALKAMGGEESAAYRAAVAAQRGFAVASSMIAIAQASAQAMGDPTKVTVEQKLIAWATIAAQGAQILATISGAGQGYRRGGHTGYGADGEEAGTVHRNEWVHSGASTRRLGVSKLKALDEGRAEIVMRRGYRSGGLVGGMAPLAPVPLSLPAAPAVNVNLPEMRVINMAPGVEVERRRQPDGSTDLLVREVKRALIDDFGSGGPASRAAGKAFGLRRAASA